MDDSRDKTLDDSASQSKKGPFKLFYGWYLVAASMFSNALVSAVYFQGFSAFVIPIESTFGWSRSVISGAASLRQAEAGIFGPITGLLLDKYGPRKIISVGAVIVGLGLVGLGFSTGLVMFYVFFLFISMGTSGVGHAVTWVVVVARWFKKRRGLAVGLAVTGPVFGAPMVVVNSWLIEEFSWRTVLIGYGLIITVVIPLIAINVKAQPESDSINGGDNEKSNSEDQGIGSFDSSEFKISLLFRNKSFWLLSAYLGSLFIVNSGFQLHQIPYFVEDHGFSNTAAAATIPLVVWASGFGRVGAGWLIDKIDYRVVLISICLFMFLGLFYLQIFSPQNLFATLPFAILFGLAFGATIPLRGVLGSMIFGTKNLGAIVGLLQGTGVAAGVIGPILMGAFRDWLGDYKVGIWILIVISLLGIIPVLLMKNNKPGKAI